MATAVFGSAHRAAPDQPRGYAEIRRFLETVAACTLLPSTLYPF
jgi:hypothetical protein